MGLLDFNVAELVSRSVRALRVRGRVPYTLDDSVVPVVQVFDATRAPYRDVEQRYRSMTPAVGPVAGEVPTFCIHNRTGQPVVLEEVEIINRSGAPQNVVSLWGLFSGTDNRFWTGEPGIKLPNIAPLGAQLLTLPGVVISYGTTPVATVPDAFSPIFAIVQSTAGVENRMRFPGLEITIPPLFGLTLGGQTVNLALQLSAVIRSTAPQP